MNRLRIKLFLELLVWIGATPVAYLMRLEGGFFAHLDSILGVTLALVPVKLTILLYFKSYRQSWHQVGLRDLLKIGVGLGFGTLVFFGMAYLLRYNLLVPYSVPLIEAMLVMLGFFGMRLATRAGYQYRVIRNNGAKQNSERVLIAGAGDAGTMIAREMMRHPEAGMEPIGFLDDDPEKQKQSFLGLPVFGATDRVANVCEHHRIDVLLIAMPSESGDTVRKIVESARGLDINYKIIPALHELISGEVNINQIREVDLKDLLRRDPVRLNTGEIAAYLKGKTVMVTGAGGSIGSEIVRQVIPFEPGKIVLVDHSEYNVYRLEHELAGHHLGFSLHSLVADVRDRQTLNLLFDDYRPQVIFHAAAHKHVPLMEKNPEQAILNNVGGTRNLVDLALEYQVDHFVNISTDKAVNPSSIMGASKRIAEYVVEEGSRRAAKSQVFVSVRFGNVLGSRGSVVPRFKEQIKNGEPVTVTHPDMKRYFMTIPEASQLVLQAGGLEESGAVYVLDMGEPIKIMDLARDLIKLSGLKPGIDIPIEITGIRPGEKLYEELLTDEEMTSSTRYEKIHMARQNGLPENFTERLEKLLAAASGRDTDLMKLHLSELITENMLPHHKEEFDNRLSA